MLIDEEVFPYFIGRRDEMMKTSDYRGSPSEFEELLYATKLVGERVAFGVDHLTLGQSLQVIARLGTGGTLDSTALLTECRRRMPACMVRAGVTVRAGLLPRNPNGKIDRKMLAGEFLADAALAADASKLDTCPEGSGK